MVEFSCKSLDDMTNESRTGKGLSGCKSYSDIIKLCSFCVMYQPLTWDRPQYTFGEASCSWTRGWEPIRVDFDLSSHHSESWLWIWLVFGSEQMPINPVSYLHGYFTAHMAFIGLGDIWMEDLWAMRSHRDLIFTWRIPVEGKAIWIPDIE